LALLIPAVPVHAGECFVGTVRKLNGTITTKSGVFIRDNACMEQSKVLHTIPGGTAVTTLGEWDGWYKVEYGGVRGWLYNTLVSSVNASDTGTTDYASFEESYPSGSTGSAAPAPATAPTTSVTTSDAMLLSRLKGYILLQVQQHGEAWYVYPDFGKRYYMKDGPTAYQMMRSFGLGITNADLTKLKAGNATLVSRLKGKIVLQVQAHGEAYYIHPKDGRTHYLKDGAEAYRIMRELSLGITDADLSKLATDTIPIK
jgi:hypothetical protein